MKPKFLPKKSTSPGSFCSQIHPNPVKFWPPFTAGLRCEMWGAGWIGARWPAKCPSCAGQGAATVAKAVGYHGLPLAFVLGDLGATPLISVYHRNSHATAGWIPRHRCVGVVCPPPTKKYIILFGFSIGWPVSQLVGYEGDVPLVVQIPTNHARSIPIDPIVL